MILLIAVTVYPLLYIVFASISDPYMLLKHDGILLGPLGRPTMKGYEITFRNPNIINGYKNTFFYVCAGTMVNLLLTSLAAYVLSRKDFYIKKIIMVMIVITMFFSGGLIPMFFIVRSLNMYDTFWAIILPTAVSSWNMIIMRTFFMGIPDSMEESAAIEGANDLIIFSRIILPLSKPVIAVMVLYYGVAHWNSWFQAMVFLRDRKTFHFNCFCVRYLFRTSAIVR